MKTPACSSLAQSWARVYRLSHLQAIADWGSAATMPPKGNQVRAGAMAEMTRCCTA